MPRGESFLVVSLRRALSAATFMPGDMARSLPHPGSLVHTHPGGRSGSSHWREWNVVVNAAFHMR